MLHLSTHPVERVEYRDNKTKLPSSVGHTHGVLLLRNQLFPTEYVLSFLIYNLRLMTLSHDKHNPASDGVVTSSGSSCISRCTDLGIIGETFCWFSIQYFPRSWKVIQYGRWSRPWYLRRRLLWIRTVHLTWSGRWWATYPKGIAAIASFASVCLLLWNLFLSRGHKNVIWNVIYPIIEYNVATVSSSYIH